ncbi:MAG: DUF2339 domain-containing protein [Myxococcaceae bacterium]|nr:DUF2339 domain-containing protein [Myxococcaceae bacterium]
MTVRNDWKVLQWAGGALLAIAGVFLWRDAQLHPAWLLSAVAVLFAALTLRAGSPLWQLGSALGLLGSAVVGVAAYAAVREPVILGALGAVGLASGLAARRAPLPGQSAERMRSLATWAALAVALLGVSGGAYFELLTLGAMSDEPARRLVLTLGWLGLGLGFLVLSLRQQVRSARDVGFGVLAIAALKALAYDSTHLGGPVRVALFAAAGLILLGAGALLPRLAGQTEAGA